MGCLGSIHHRRHQTQLNKPHFFPLLSSSLWIKSSYIQYKIGSLSCGASFWEWHLHHKLHGGGSGVMAPNFSLRWTVTVGWCVVGLVSLSFTGRGGDHIDYHSCFFQIHLHHPAPPTSPAIFSITFHWSGGMMEMAGAERMQPISDITSKI